MADAALDDFFAKKTKKKIKGSNLNVAAAAPKAEPKKKAKDAEEDGWEEETVIPQTIKTEAAGKLTRDEDKKEEDDSSAPAWGSVPKKYEQQHRDPREERKFPSLAKSVQSTNIQVDDGQGPKVNISTSKNIFAALEGEEDDEEGGKRPKEIQPAKVQKKKGEREKEAVQREIDKWGGSKEKGDKKDRKDAKDDDEDEEDDDEREDSAPAQEPAGGKKSKAEVKSVKSTEPEVEEETPEDLLIKLDPAKVASKYNSRRRLEPKTLPDEEMQAEKENRPAKGPAGKKKKVFEEEEEKKLEYVED
mmetsp:Transcript_7882/g.18426  ORF Transcript_7882/g.18426 Transcript_7882/m.18426 type:complete len:303 (-) Transcript_7882:91-999(-)